MNVSGGEFSNGTTPTTLILDGDTPAALPTLRLKKQRHDGKHRQYGRWR